MKTIENNQDFEQLMAQEKPVLIDFYADWCGPCQTLLPTVEKLSKEYEGKVEIQKVNVDRNADLASKFGVRGIPALFLIKNAKIIDQISGLVPESLLREKLNVAIS